MSSLRKQIHACMHAHTHVPRSVMYCAQTSPCMWWMQLMEKAAQKAQVSIVISAQRNAAQRHTRGGVKQCWQAAHALFKNKSKKCPLKCQWCFRQCWLGRGVRITVINGPGVGGIASVWLLCCCCYPWFKPPPFFFFFPFLLCMCASVCEEEEQMKNMIQTETERHGETLGIQSVSSYS